jgi:hypothetical protein
MRAIAGGAEGRGVNFLAISSSSSRLTLPLRVRTFSDAASGDSSSSSIASESTGEAGPRLAATACWRGNAGNAGLAGAGRACCAVKRS